MKDWIDTIQNLDWNEEQIKEAYRGLRLIAGFYTTDENGNTIISNESKWAQKIILDISNK